MRIVGALAVALLFAARVGAAPPSIFHFVGGGTMSSYSKLVIDLDSGSFQLAETKSARSDEAVEEHEGHIDPTQLAGLRETVAFVLSEGLRSQFCIARAAQSPPDSIYRFDMPLTMDYSPTMYLFLAGKEGTAPRDPECWSDAAHQIKQAAFAAAQVSMGQGGGGATAQKRE